MTTYKGFLLRNHKHDSLENYKEFLSRHDIIAKMMNASMFEQYAEKTYGMRFVLSN